MQIRSIIYDDFGYYIYPQVLLSRRCNGGSVTYDPSAPVRLGHQKKGRRTHQAGRESSASHRVATPSAAPEVPHSLNCQEGRVTTSSSSSSSSSSSRRRRNARGCRVAPRVPIRAPGVLPQPYIPAAAVVMPDHVKVTASVLPEELVLAVVGVALPAWVPVSIPTATRIEILS